MCYVLSYMLVSMGFLDFPHVKQKAAVRPQVISSAGFVCFDSFTVHYLNVFDDTWIYFMLLFMQLATSLFFFVFLWTVTNETIFWGIFNVILAVAWCISLFRWSRGSPAEVYVDITMRAAKETEISTAEQYARESIRIARTTRGGLGDWMRLGFESQETLHVWLACFKGVHLLVCFCLVMNNRWSNSMVKIVQSWKQPETCFLGELLKKFAEATGCEVSLFLTLFKDWYCFSYIRYLSLSLF